MAWDPAEEAQIVSICKQAGLYLENGTARCVFCRPTDKQFGYLLATGFPFPSDGGDLVEGQNIYSLHWWSDSLRDSLGLARKLRKMLPAGAKFGYHSGSNAHLFVARRS